MFCPQQRFRGDEMLY